MSKRLKPFAKGTSLFGRHAVYARENELLLVDGYYVERYRRFPYEDIQAICWSKASTLTRLLSAILGLLALISLILWLNGEWVGFWICISMTLVPALTLMFNALQGGKVQTYVVTPAQQTKFSCIQTKRKLDKLFAILEEKGVLLPPDHASEDS